MPNDPSSWVRPLRWAGPPMSREPDLERQEAFALPVGTVTFLLTDVEGSTQAWEANGPAMAGAIGRHYAILDAAVSAHGGVRPQEQGEGDSIVAAFGRASDALAAAIDAQRALTAEPWTDELSASLKVRMAVHTGEAQMRNEANYVGQAIIRTARLRAIAHGGQILVSQAARDLAVDQRGAELELLDLGVHRLKDLARPEHVWQLVAHGLEREFPVLRSLDATPNNLPLELSSFIGREAEIATVADLVAQHRLVVVNGAGGAGKTRLAQQVAAQLSDRYPDGVWWVELAPLDSGSVLSAIASIVSVREPEKLVERLADRRVLLVLDNCEHVLDVVSPLVHQIHAACAHVHVLATSRGPLDVPGEITWRVPPLGCPQPGTAAPVAALAQFDAVRLFVERARRARPNFELTNENGPIVAELCARLDGIPLAIELAAARAKSLTPVQILAGLEDSLRLLTGGARVVLPRQQTLEASIDWSHNLLGARERVLLRRLSVFAGSCDLAAAEHVCGYDDELREMDVLDALERLIDQSLVTVDDTASAARYRLLETVRQYGARHLVEAGERDVSVRRHTDWYCRLAAEIGPQAETSREDECIAVLYPERENIAAIMVRLREAHDAERLGTLVLDLAAYWDHSQQEVTGSEWTTVALDLFGTEPSLRRGRLLQARGKHDSLVGNYARMAVDAPDALNLAEQFDDVERIGRARWLVAGMMNVVDRDAGGALYDQAYAECRRAGDRYGTAIVAVNRGGFDAVMGHLTRARTLNARARSDVAAAANPSMSNTLLAMETQVHRIEGDYDAARRTLAAVQPKTGVPYPPILVQLIMLVEVAGAANDGTTGPTIDELRALVRSFERRDHAVWAAILRAGLAGALHARGDLVGARVEADAALAAAFAAGPAAIAFVSDLPMTGAMIALALGDVADAAQRLEMAAPFVVPGRNNVAATAFHLAQAMVTRMTGDLNAAESSVHLGLGIAAEQGMLPALLLALELLAGIATSHGSWLEAARLAGVAQQQREQRRLGLRVEPHRSQHERDQAATRQALGDAFDAAFAEGRGLALDDAVAFAQRSRGERGRPTLGWRSLTPTERRVADLARAGHTNAAIGRELLMGAETVKTHLSHVYAKVGVANRTQLAALLPPQD